MKLFTITQFQGKVIPSIVEDIKALEIWGSEPNQASLWSPQSTVKIYSITKKTHLKYLYIEYIFRAYNFVVGNKN